METNRLLMTQDLADILHINQERVNGYNKSAYNCQNMQLKMLLNRELDNARDSINSLRHLLVERFEMGSEPENKGQLFSIWSDFKPSFDEADVNIQLHTYEMADLLTLQCYRLIIARPYIDDISKNLLEFQYQKHVSIYNGMKAFRAAHRTSINYAMLYSAGRRSA
jgi:hypothetical protein